MTSVEIAGSDSRQELNREEMLKKLKAEAK